MRTAAAKYKNLHRKVWPKIDCKVIKVRDLNCWAPWHLKPPLQQSPLRKYWTYLACAYKEVQAGRERKRIRRIG